MAKALCIVVIITTIHVAVFWKVALGFAAVTNPALLELLSLPVFPVARMLRLSERDMELPLSVINGAVWGVAIYGSWFMMRWRPRRPHDSD